MLIVDLGFSSAKWLHGDKKGTVRSCFRKSKSDVEGYLYHRDRYLVGERALLETGSRYLRTVEDLVDLYPLFVSACAHKAGIRQDGMVVVGLPYDYRKGEVTKARKGVVVFDTVLFFGGGARLLNGKVESSRVNVVILDEPEFANALGFRIRMEESAKGGDTFQGGTQN